MRTKAELLSGAILAVIAITAVFEISVIYSHSHPPTPAITATEAVDRAKAAHAQGNDALELSWTRVAAIYGDAASQNALGLMYEQGRGIPQDRQEAARWYHKAFEQGNAEAKANLARLAAEDVRSLTTRGVAYDRGEGVPQDHAEAARLYREAIKLGGTSAKANLARLYAFGLGVPTDLDEAERLFREAAAAGVPTARRSLEMVRAKKIDNRNTAITLGVGAVLFGGMSVLTAPGDSNDATPNLTPGGVDLGPLFMDLPPIAITPQGRR